MESRIGAGSVGRVCQRMLNIEELRDESVVVTHVESPEKFFCRLDSNQNSFDELNQLVGRRVNSPFLEPPVPSQVQVDDFLLAYSSIHQHWCRSRVQQIMESNGSEPLLAVGARGQTQMCAKVYLIDFGSAEIVTFQNLRLTTDEIIDFNSGQSFCFECSLSHIKPYSEPNQWSSYANYLFEKLTKDKIITLKYQQFCDGVVVCDLSSFGPTNRGLNESFHSMVDYLVHTRVARYKMGQYFYHRLFPNDGPDYDHQNPNPEDFEYNSDEDLNSLDLKNENKLFFH